MDPSEDSHQFLSEQAFLYAQEYRPLSGKSTQRLAQRYFDIIKTQKLKYQLQWDKPTPKVIWQCWLQGLDKAPKSVRFFTQTVKKHHPEFTIHQINESNFQDFVQMPPILIKKYRSGMIPMPHFTDLIRLYLLDQHGGHWVDSTVYCSDTTPLEITHSHLFLFQGKKHQNISN